MLATLRDAMRPAEVAWLSGITEKEVNKAVDDKILPLFYVHKRTLPAIRLYAPLAAVLMSFNRAAQDILSKKTRVEIINLFTERVIATPGHEGLIALQTSPDPESLRICTGIFEFSFESFFCAVKGRLSQLDEAEAAVITDPEIMGGLAVFKGTRVPIEFVLASLEDGTSFDELKLDHEFLTTALIEDARVYKLTHPRRGRPVSPQVRKASRAPRD